MISALVLTYNEENIIGKCLSAINFADEIIVFDSMSTDNTVSIAKEMGAKVCQRRFDNYANQRNEALKAVSADSDWVLMVDADEIVTPGLKDEILRVISAGDKKCSLFYVRRKDNFENKWIRFSSGYPTWFGRLFRNGQVEVRRGINEEYHTDGAKGYLKEHLTHFPFNKGMSHWFEKHNRYSTMEAALLMEEANQKFRLSDILSADPLKRRRTQKMISYKLPFRPFFVFIAFYIIRGGFLDGRRGYTFCRLRMTYEWMIGLKLRELRSWRNER